MSNLPEFLQPLNKEQSQKPEPKAGLSEFLRGHVTQVIDKLHYLEHPTELLLKIESQTILWLDLEINPKTEALIDGALVVGDFYWRFNAVQFKQYAVIVYHMLDQSRYLAGHNIIEFDLPRLVPLLLEALDSTRHEHRDVMAKLINPIATFNLQRKAWDTLILSSLLIPHQPSHALAKLYKANVDYNEPILDCLESRFVFELCQKSWQVLPPDVQIVFYKLLPQLNALDDGFYFQIDVNNILDMDAIFEKLPEGNSKQLISLLNQAINETREHVTTNHSLSNDSNNYDYDYCNDRLWQNVGIAAFINWLRYFGKPQARRPVWLNKHPIYSAGFQQAEQAFWCLENPTETWINQQCQYFFGFDTLRGGQMSIVKAVLMNNDIPLGILPTGGGKSLTFQLPALIFSKYQRKLTVVISPLKALIEDQVVNLHEQLPDYESRIAYLTSGQTPETQQIILTGIWQGDIDIIYLSPERLRTHSIRQLFKNRPPAFWVLDEAHTLSQWGTDFRPDFLRIADHILACYSDEVRKKVNDNLLGLVESDSQQLDFLALNDSNDGSIDKSDKYVSEQKASYDGEAREKALQADDTLFNNAQRQHSIKPNKVKFIAPTISLVTATASVRVKDDLENELVNKLEALTGNKQLVQYGTSIDNLKIWRDDITAHCIEVTKEARKTVIFKTLQTRKQWYENQYPKKPELGVAIVYLRSRKGCDEYAEDFAQQGLSAAAYHSKLDDIQKKVILAKFKNNELDVVVCTNAFGMGIDKEGIHTVIHSGPPSNIESYIQEIGRAARKKHEVGEAYLLWSDEDVNLLFLQERNSRIPNTNTLKDCWTAIRPTLKKPLQDQWFSGAMLSPILETDHDIERLNTQVRVALLALERYGLLTEKDQQPAWISIRLLNTPPASQDTRLAKLYEQLRQICDDTRHITQSASHKSEASDDTLNRYHLPELAMALGYSVKNLLKLLRELVKQGFAQWQVVVRVRLKYTHRYLKGEFNRLMTIVDALQSCLTSAHINLDSGDELENQGYTRLNTKALDNWLVQQRLNLSCKRHILPMFRSLGILKIRSHNRYQVFVSSTEYTKKWMFEQQRNEGWSSWLTLAAEMISELTPLFEDCLLQTLPDQKDGLGKEFNLDTIAEKLKRPPDTILSQLEQLQQLELIELSRLDDDKNAIFFIGSNQKSISRYNEVAYRYLKTHYQDRCARIHVLNHWLRADSKVQQAMIEDYFSKPLDEVVTTYISSSVDATKPYIKDYAKKVLPNFFSAIQSQIVQETSRAAMVLAGPGSGKTTVVVHRVAYLLMIEEIKAEKILILAYNRLAVLELRARLSALIGYHAIGVTIQTFHGLARQLTGLNEKDAPEAALEAIASRIPHLNLERNRQKRQDNARYQWMIEEAVRQLKERPQHYQYIMVDEFQDIDEFQYEMIGLLADLQKKSDEVLADSEDGGGDGGDPLSDSSTDDFEQRGYLMVVGDDDQNLYSFRGASIEYIQKFADNYHIDTNQKYYLLDNYRSANNLVAIANDFIKRALPKNARLKEAEHQIQATNAHPDLPIRHGFYQQLKGVDMASWLAGDIKQVIENANLELQPSIAILAPKWAYFDAIQHFLEALDIVSQRYNESDQIIPINSVIGQALFTHLSDNRLSVIEGKVSEYLEQWRNTNQFNHLDRAWQAIINQTSSLQAVSYEQVLQVLEATLFDNKTQVILITYHSAKGMEFDHVYVIDECNPTNNKGDSQDIDRPLYVAMTRAKQTLTVLQHQKRHHPVLADVLNNHAETIELPHVTIPTYLTFHRFLRLDEIVLTPRTLVSTQGRVFIETLFCKNSWSEDRAAISHLFAARRYQRNVYPADGFYSIGQETLIVELSKAFTQEHLQEASQNAWPEFIGFTTTLFYQQDIDYYKRVGYNGGETSHYLIVPYVRFNVRCV